MKSTHRKSVITKSALILSLVLVQFTTSKAEAKDITQVQRDTEFYLNRTIEIPANHTTLFLGKSGFDTLLNSIAQVGNHNSNNFYYYQGHYWHPSYSYYLNDYFMQPGSFWQTYWKCLQRNTYTYIHPRHRKQSNNNQMIINGNNNSIQINDSPNFDGYNITYAENCIEPMYTMSFLEFTASPRERVLGPKNSKGQVRPLKIKSVRQRNFNYGYEISLYFQHPVIKRLVILTNHNPREIYLSNLDKSGDGWAGAFESMGNVTDELFSIQEPDFVEVID